MMPTPYNEIAEVEIHGSVIPSVCRYWLIVALSVESVACSTETEHRLFLLHVLHWHDNQQCIHMLAAALAIAVSQHIRCMPLPQLAAAHRTLQG